MHFIYLTTNLINGKRYVGRRKGDPEVEVNYLGSGKIFVRALKKYGRENFKREILEICDSRQDAYEAEEKWIAHFDAANSDEFYNISPLSRGGGNHGGTRVVTEETREKLRQAAKNRTPEWKEKQRLANLGKKASEEKRAKMSAAQKRRREAMTDAERDEHRRRSSEGKKAGWSKRKTLSPTC